MLLEKLCNSLAPSGYEGDVREIIKNELKDFVDDIKIDRMGNIIAHKKGNGPKVLIDTHMDEVGFIITSFNEDGTLKFAPLGDIDTRIIPCNQVLIGEKKINGVIGLKPIHLQDKNEREKNISYNDCCIDIGSSSKEQSKKFIKLGDFAVFDTDFCEFGNGLVKGKAIDNRIGCAVLINLLKDKYNCDLYGVFNVQKETGERGAYVSAFNINPDISIIIDASLSGDVPGVPENLKICDIGKGPVIPIKDKNVLFSKCVINKILDVAQKSNINYQYKKKIVEQSDSIALEMTQAGINTAAVFIPCRYIRSSMSICSLEDYNNTIKLMINYLKTI